MKQDDLPARGQSPSLTPIASDTELSLSSDYSLPLVCRRKILAMSKTEIALIIIMLLILAVCVWFIFSNQIWVMVSYLETLLYPEIVTPE